MTGELADAVALARPADLLPARLSDEGAALPRQVALVAAERLDERCWLAVLEDPSGGPWAAPVVADGVGVRRARPGDGAAEALLRLLHERGAAVAPDGPGFRWTTTGAASCPAGERAMGVDQTHESVVVGETAVVKWSVAAAESPAPLLLSHLHHLTFPDVPEPWGFVQHDGRLLVAVDRFLPGAVDGWTWAVDEVGAAAVEGRRADTASAVGLGELVGRLHVALATPSPFLPDPVSTAGQDAVRAWHARAESALERAIELVAGPEGDRLRAVAPRARQELSAMLDVDSTPVTALHGDLHVGQVLRWDGGLVVTDFDGNPVLPPEERATQEPPARDVAGMLQSIDHVGRVVVRRVAGASPPAVEDWIDRAQQDFLDAYRRTLREADRSYLLDERLLRAFAVEQECREYAYAAEHLPRWGYVPDAAMAALFDEE